MERTADHFRPPASIAPGIVLVTCALLAGLYWISTQIAREQYRDLLTVMVLIQGVWIVLRWRMGVYIFVVYVAIEGFIINFFYTIPELNLLKDFLAMVLFLVLVLYTATGTKVFPIPRTAWTVPFVGFSAIYILEVFNPSLPNLLVGLIGIRATLLFFVLMPVGYWFFESKDRVLEFFSFLLVLSIPIALFGLVQYFMGPAWVTSLSPGFGRAVFYAVGSKGLTSSAYFRTFSTFVHTGGFGQFLVLCMLLCVSFWLLPSFRARRWQLSLLFVLLTAALLTTGSRSSLVWFVVGLALMATLLLSPLRMIPVLLVVPLILWGAILLGGVGFAERYATLLDLDYIQGRNMPLLVGWLQESMKTDWIGLGAGYASVASRHAGITPLNSSVVENGLAKIRFETGLAGLVLYLCFVILMLKESLSAPLKVRDLELRLVGVACGAFVFVNLITVAMGTPFDASPTNTLLWFFAGLLARLPLLEGSSPGTHGPYRT